MKQKNLFQMLEEGFVETNRWRGDCKVYDNGTEEIVYMRATDEIVSREIKDYDELHFVRGYD